MSQSLQDSSDDSAFYMLKPILSKLRLLDALSCLRDLEIDRKVPGGDQGRYS